MGRDLLSAGGGVNPFHHFNPRALVGRDRRYYSSVLFYDYFNPRALVGRDSVVNIKNQKSLISIHAPSWGAT